MRRLPVARLRGTHCKSTCEHAVVFIDPAVLIAEFGPAAKAAGIPGWPCELRAETLRAPHHPPPLPVSSAAVYMFALHGSSTAPGGAGLVLKVGKVGPNSRPRFAFQHYGLAARSTLAGSLLRYPIMWPWLGVQNLAEATVRSWMLSNLDRGHIYVPGDAPEVLASLEVYVRARVGSVFEGAA